MEMEVAEKALQKNEEDMRLLLEEKKKYEKDLKEIK